MVGVSLEIDHCPGAALEERQVDVPFEQPSSLGLHRNGQLAMAARGRAGAPEQRVLERGRNRFDGGLNFVRQRAQDASVDLCQARDLLAPVFFSPLAPRSPVAIR